MTLYKVFLQTEKNNDLFIFDTINHALEFAENTAKNNIFVKYITVHRMEPTKTNGVMYNKDCIFTHGTYNKNITTWLDDVL